MKRCLVRLLAVVCYWCGIDALFYALNRRAKRIVTFHNVLPDALFRPGLANGVSNSLSDFARIVDECAKRFPISNDLFDPKTLTITFDDGYRNQYTTAFRHLKERGLPAILFMAGDLAPESGGELFDCLNVGTRNEKRETRNENRETRDPRTATRNPKPLFIDLLLHEVSEAPIERIPGGDRLAYWMQTVWPAFCRNPNPGTRNSTLDTRNLELETLNLPSAYLEERLGRISASELDEMRAAGWQIGWHTQSHVPLASLSEAAVRAELNSPAVFRPVCLSYPFGNPEEVGELAPRIAEELGYPCAVSNTNTAPDNATSRYFLPRLALPADRYELHFELSGLKFFIKHHRLLPLLSS